MARANDNWEKLVGPVLRRNKIWEMFHAQSRTPSMSSAASSETGLTDDPFLDLSLIDDSPQLSFSNTLKSNEKFASRRFVEDQILEALRICGTRGIEGVGEMVMSHDGAPVMGGGLSQNWKLSFGYASAQGKRSSMEDFYETRIDSVDGEKVGQFGVFDGHGGARAAKYVKENLFSNLIRHPKLFSDTKSAIADAYSHTDTEFLKMEINQKGEAGSTASTAILVAGRLLVANVGDSRAVICRAGNAIAVSEDHKPNRKDELRRIEDAGGVVLWAGTWRVGGMLSVSRSFGHRMLKQFVVADPEIQEVNVDETLEFLILASKGLWSVVGNEEAVLMTQPIQEPEEAAQRLMREAVKRGSAENITIIVVRFRVTKMKPCD